MSYTRRITMIALVAFTFTMLMAPSAFAGKVDPYRLKGSESTSCTSCK